MNASEGCTVRVWNVMRIPEFGTPAEIRSAVKLKSCDLLTRYSFDENC